MNRRTFNLSDDGDPRAELPLDALGRHRWRSALSSRAVQRSVDGTGAIGFRGTAIVFNKRTWIGSRQYGFWEQIAPEAVAKTLREADVRFLINHDPNLLLARNTAGTLRLTSDGSTGLSVDADMAPTSYAQDLAILLERGDISQMSFAFEPLAWRTETAEDGNPLYTMTELRLADVSVVTYPAYETTDAGLRGAAFDAVCRTLNIDADELLRLFDGGESIDDLLSQRAATGPAESTPTTPPAESTAPTSNPLALAHLVRATQLAKESISGHQAAH